MTTSTSSTWWQKLSKSVFAAVLTAITFALISATLALVNTVVGWFIDSFDLFLMIIEVRNWAVENATPIKLEALRNSVFAAHAETIFWVIACTLIFLWIRSRSLSDWADFHLFSDIDKELLQPLPRYTGILKWAGPQGLQEHAWNSMSVWLPSDKSCYVDSKSKWRSRKPNVQKPFSWMVLSGPNGMGKTQMSLEFAKSLTHARGGTLTNIADGESSRLRKILTLIHFWWNRDSDDPWDVGCLRFQSTNAVTHLTQWRPRRPTLIILDDPLPSLFPEQLKVLATNQRLFSYPVRLLVVDQFEPGTTLPKGDGGLKERSATISSVEFSIEACGTALRVNLPEAVETESAPRVQYAHVKELWDVENRNQFHAHTHGFPLIVALGALWLLRPGNSVHQLSRRAYLDDEDQTTKVYRSTHSVAMGPAAHQLIEQRAMELFETLPKHDIDLLKALACSTLSNGIPMNVMRDRKSNFGNLPTVDELKKMFPHHAWNPVSGKTELFPCITPSFVAEVFLTKILPEQTGESLDSLLPALARQAWQLRPQGMARSVLRHPWRQVDLVKAIQTIPELAPEYYPELVRAFIENAVLHQGPVQVALDFIDKLAGQTIGPAERPYLDLIDHIKKLGDQPSADTPNSVVLMCALACYLPEDDLQESAQQLQILLPTWWRSHRPRGRKSSSITLPSDELDSFQSLATSVLARYCQRVAPVLLKQIETPEDFFELFSLFWNPLNCLLYGRDWRNSAFTARLNFRRFCIALENFSPLQSAVLVVEQNGAPEQQPYFFQLREEFAVLSHGEIESQLSALNLDSDASDLLLAWHWVEMAQLSSEFATNLPALFEASTISNTLPSLRRLQVFALRFLRVMVTNAFSPSKPESANLTWKQMGHIAKSLPDFYEAQFEVASAWLSIASACSIERGYIEHTKQCIEKIEAIHQALPEYSTDHELQLLRAESWRSLAYAHSRESEHVAHNERATEQIEAFIKESPLFSVDRELQIIRLQVWRDLAFSSMRTGCTIEHTKQAVEHIETIAEKFPQFIADHDFQLPRLEAWGFLAAQCCVDPQRKVLVRHAAERMEIIAQALPQVTAHGDLQIERAHAWQAVAAAFSTERGNTAQVLKAAQKVTNIFEASPHSHYLRTVCIRSWALVGSAYGNETGFVEQTRQAVERVEALIATIPYSEVDLDVHLLRVQALRSLAVAYSNERGYIEQTRQIVEQVDDMIQTLPQFAINLAFQFERLQAWLHLAFACCKAHGHIEPTRRAVEKIEAILLAQQQLGPNREFQLLRARAWANLIFACSNEQGQSVQSEKALKQLERACAAFPNDADFQRLLRESNLRLFQTNPLTGPTLLSVQAGHK